jgi:uncharacterized protein (TIGR00645 family)
MPSPLQEPPMTQTPPQRPKEPLLERAIESVIFSSRWLMAPIYLGLIAALFILIVIFFRELAHALPNLMEMEESDAILLILTLVDISLAGNLVLIILFSGYESFVSKIGAADHPDRPSWMGKLDFSGLKSKLIASIVAISAIHLLKIFMDLSKYEQSDLMWYTLIHLTFVGSGIGFALMDRLDLRGPAKK